MKTYPKAPPLPGADRPHNLVATGPDIDSCPCCGAVWKGGKPWSETTMSPMELAQAMGTSNQAVTQRIRNGSIAAYLCAGSGAKNYYTVPIFEYQRLQEQQPGKGGPRPEKVAPVQDLGVNHG